MKIVFATHNKNKLKEVQSLMPAHIDLLSLWDIDITEDIPETSATISGNAILKVEYIKQRCDLPIFADDTGLLVDALRGAPGVHTARYAGEQATSEDNITKMLEELDGLYNRAAHFSTVIALDMDDCQLLFEGICHGDITKEKMGDSGFGYDPIFKPTGYDHTFAQMTMDEKAAISHRAIALKKLIAYLSKTS